MSGSVWLLLLGSNEGSDRTLQGALTELAELGAVECLGVRHLPPRAGSGPWYFNALVMLRSEAADAELRVALRDIEQRLGRDRATPERVSIDIDVLAKQGERWLGDPHALAKGELDRYPATTLLAEAGIMVWTGQD